MDTEQLNVIVGIVQCHIKSEKLLYANYFYLITNKTIEKKFLKVRLSVITSDDLITEKTIEKKILKVLKFECAYA